MSIPYIKFPFTLQQLLIFKIVIIKQNLTQASETLYISQPALSKKLKKLENDCNIIFLNRKKKKIFLTETGQIFFQYIERVLDICEESYRILEEFKIGDRGDFKLGISSTLDNSIISKLLFIFARTYPRLKINVQVNSNSKLLENLTNNRINSALIENFTSTIKKKDFNFTELAKNELVLVISSSHPFSIKKKIYKSDLYELNFINLKLNHSLKTSINLLLNQHKIKTESLKIVLKLNSLKRIKKAVQLGLGVAFLPSIYIQNELRFNTIKVLRITNTRIYKKLVFIYSKKNYSNLSLKVFQREIDIIKKKIKN